MRSLWGGNFSVEANGAGATTNTRTFSGAMDLGGATRTITADASASNFIFSGEISNGGLTKAGNQTLTISGSNTYTGDTTVSAGTLLLSDNAQLVFDIGANGVNNSIEGTGTLTLDGDFNFDLTGAATSAASWNIVNVATLNETFGSTFSVVGFTDAGSDTWTKTIGASTYTFDEAIGVLSVIPEPSTIALLAVFIPFLTAMRRRRTM